MAAWLETALTMVFFLILVVDGGDASSHSATRNLALLVRVLPCVLQIEHPEL